MDVTKIVSDVYKIDAAIGSVYSFLSDFNRVGAMVQVAQQMGMKMNEEVARISDSIENTHFEQDLCRFKVKGLGDVELSIVERNAATMIKLMGGGQLPFEFFVWIQLVEKAPYDTRVRITMEADLNMMMKMFLKGKLEKGVNQFAEALTKLPYGSL